jgi:hypothetical protein
MMNRTCITVAALFVSLACGGIFKNCRAAEVSVSHQYAPLEWNYKGGAIPETYWSPYLPLGMQNLLRFKVGFRFSTGTIGVRCPVKLTFRYDSACAKSGKDLNIKVKAELVHSDRNTFESAFGLFLPNEVQIGLFGITGVPDLLPWYTLPWDLCDILGQIPGLPATVTDKVTAVCALIDNIGVNMSTKDALPLSATAATATFDDKRTLFEFNLTDAMSDKQKEAFVNAAATSLFNRFSSLFTSVEMDAILMAIQTAKNVDKQGATVLLTGMFGKVAEKLMDFGKVTTIGDPYFKIEGVELTALLRAYIPGGKGSGTYPLVFKASGEEKTITFRDINPFIQGGDKLVVAADQLAYRFKLKQGLIPKIKVSVLPDFNFSTPEKYVDLATAKKDSLGSEYKLEIPLAANNDIIQSLRVQPGCTSVGVFWTSPRVMLKGTVRTYDGAALVSAITENRFDTAHNVIVGNLAKKKTYRFSVECVDGKGLQVPAMEISDSTRASCPPPLIDSVDNGFKLSGLTAQSGTNWIQLSWTTNQLSSTEAYLSTYPDYVTYVASIKKQNGDVVTGWADRGGLREFVTAHSIRITGLNPGTTYYYNARSNRFENNTDAQGSNSLEAAGRTGQIATQAPPFVKVLVQCGGTTVSDIPVEVTRSGALPQTCVTGSDGKTAPVILEPGATYTFAVKNQFCYPDAAAPLATIPAAASGEQTTIQITLADNTPKGAAVFDAQGNPISGAVAKSGSHQAATDVQGHYNFGSWVPAGGAVVTISKPGYAGRQITGTVTPCGASRSFVIPDCILQSSVAALSVTVKNKAGSPVSNASVTVMAGTTGIGSGVMTDAQGRAAWVYDFTENAQMHNVTVKAEPSGSALKCSTAQVSINGGSGKDVELICFPLPASQQQQNRGAAGPGRYK